MDGILVEIVAFQGISFQNPEISRLFLSWDTVHTKLYTIIKVVKVKGDYIGDEHLNALDKAFKAGQIAHWSVNDHGMEMSASTYDIQFI